MRLNSFVIGCCGLSGFQHLPPTKELFIKQAKIQTHNDPMRGSHVIVTTRHTQYSQETYLEELGFVRVSRERNTNSGNYVSLWVMSRAKFNQKIRRLMKRVPVEQVNGRIFG